MLRLDHGSWTPDAGSAPRALLHPAADVEVRRGLALAHLPGCPRRGTRGTTASGAGRAGASSLTSPGDAAPGTGWRPRWHHGAGTKQTDPGWKPRPHGPEVHRTERGRGRQVEGRRSQNAEAAPRGSLPKPGPDREHRPPTAPPGSGRRIWTRRKINGPSFSTSVTWETQTDTGRLGHCRASGVRAVGGGSPQRSPSDRQSASEGRLPCGLSGPPVPLGRDEPSPGLPTQASLLSQGQLGTNKSPPATFLFA